MVDSAARRTVATTEIGTHFDARTSASNHRAASARLLRDRRAALGHQEVVEVLKAGGQSHWGIQVVVPKDEHGIAWLWWFQGMGDPVLEEQVILISIHKLFVVRLLAV